MASGYRSIRYPTGQDGPTLRLGKPEQHRAFVLPAPTSAMIPASEKPIARSSIDRPDGRYLGWSGGNHLARRGYKPASVNRLTHGTQTCPLQSASAITSRYHVHGPNVQVKRVDDLLPPLRDAFSTFAPAWGSIAGKPYDQQRRAKARPDPVAFGKCGRGWEGRLDQNGHLRRGAAAAPGIEINERPAAEVRGCSSRASDFPPRVRLAQPHRAKRIRSTWN